MKLSVSGAREHVYELCQAKEGELDWRERDSEDVHNVHAIVILCSEVDLAVRCIC